MSVVTETLLRLMDQNLAAESTIEYKLSISNNMSYIIVDLPYISSAIWHPRLMLALEGHPTPVDMADHCRNKTSETTRDGDSNNIFWASIWSYIISQYFCEVGLS
jgi:hypothetical protein